VGPLLLSLLLQIQEPRERLETAIRETKLEEAQIALALLQAADGARAARAILVNLARWRERQAQLLLATVQSRAAYDGLDSSMFTFNLEEEKTRQKALAVARDRVQTACRTALDGEKIYAALLRTLGSLRPEAVPVLSAEAIRTANWVSRAEILEALGAMGAKADIQVVVEREKEPAVIAVGLGAVPLDRAVEYLAHPQWQVRLAAVRSLGESRGAVGMLAQGLGEMDLRMRNAAVRTLTSLTRTELPPDPTAWKDWWRANGDDFREGRYSPGTAKAAAGPGRTTFYGMPVLSSRVCFVIDRSGSMRQPGRYDVACRELKRQIEALPDGARLNLIFFGATQSCFSAAPTRVLDRAARKEALDFVDRQTFEAGTDLYAALEKALSFVGSPDSGRLREDGPDTIIVLSDGQANVGRLVDDELVARVIARRSHWIGPAIHTVTLSSEAKSLKMLAEFTGGVSTSK